MGWTKLVLAGWAGIALAGCGHESAVTPPPESIAQTSSGSVPGPTSALNDPQIAAILQADNAGELEMAQLAVERATDPRVKDFAEHHLSDHTALAREQGQLWQKMNVSPQNSDTSTKLAADMRQNVEALRGYTGTELDRAYIESQVKIHKELLSLIDVRLLDSAHDPTLRSSLQDMRQHVAAHLAVAQELLNTLMR